MSILLSEVVEACELEKGAFFDSMKDGGYCYGVEVDIESFSPNDILKDMSFKAVFEDGELEEKLVDVLISYSLSGVNVTLEVHDYENTDIDYILNIANNIGFDIAIVPSDDLILKKSSDWSGYTSFLSEFSKQYLNKKTKISLVPLVNYMEYLFAEVYSGGELEGLTPKDTYTIEKFTKVIPQDIVDAFKLELKEIVYDHFGGQDKFKEFSINVLSVARDKVKSNLYDIKKNQEASKENADDGDNLTKKK